jgi:hypothetical protein
VLLIPRAARAECRAQTGAAIFVDSGSALAVRDTVLRHNVASDNGGAVTVQVWQLSVVPQAGIVRCTTRSGRVHVCECARMGPIWCALLAVMRAETVDDFLHKLQL